MGLTKAQRYNRMMDKIFTDYKNNPNNLCVICYQLMWGRDVTKCERGLCHAKCLELANTLPF
jgi:hypothetical protein